MEVYKRIAMVEDEESRLSIEEELIDRFGDIPEPVENLIRIAQLRGVTRKLGVSHLSLRPDGVHLRLDERHMPEPDRLFEAITKADGRLRFAVGKKPELVLCERNLSPEAAVDMAIPCDDEGSRRIVRPAGRTQKELRRAGKSLRAMKSSFSANKNGQEWKVQTKCRQEKPDGMKIPWKTQGLCTCNLAAIRVIIHLSRPPKRSLPLIQEVNDDGICNF